MPIKSINLDYRLSEAVEAYSKRHTRGNFSAAISRLIELGMEADQSGNSLERQAETSESILLILSELLAITRLVTHKENKPELEKAQELAKKLFAQYSGTVVE